MIPLDEFENCQVKVSLQPLVESENEKCTLQFTVVKAKDLEKADYIGKSDPYIVATYKEDLYLCRHDEIKKIFHS